jgi:hypothetical protein
MKKVLPFAAVAEAATGLALLVSPVIVVRLLLGADLAGLLGRDDLAAAGIIIARVAGVALIALGVACWPGATALCGMLTYSALTTVYLGCLAIGGEWVGPLLWPAVALHAVLTILLARAWLGRNTVKKTDTANE